MESNPAYTRNLLPKGDRLPELLEMADLVREMVETPAWQFVQAQIVSFEQLRAARLLNETCKPDDVPYLRGQLAGLASMREAADSIVAYAEEAERKANARTAQETRT